LTFFFFDEPDDDECIMVPFSVGGDDIICHTYTYGYQPIPPFSGLVMDGSTPANGSNLFFFSALLFHRFFLGDQAALKRHTCMQPTVAWCARHVVRGAYPVQLSVVWSGSRANEGVTHHQGPLHGM
jgi:hypothetical protein